MPMELEEKNDSGVCDSKTCEVDAAIVEPAVAAHDDGIHVAPLAGLGANLIAVAAAWSDPDADCEETMFAIG